MTLAFVGSYPRCDRCHEFKDFANGPLGMTVEYCPRCDPTPSPFTMVRSSGTSKPNRPGLAVPILTVSGGNNPSGLARRERALTPHPSPQPEPSAMPTYNKKCNRSGKAFTSPGAAARYCGTCPECKLAIPAKAPTPRSVRAKPVNTGFAREVAPTARAGYGDTIAQLKRDLAGLETRRIELTDAIAALERLGAA